MMPTSIKIGKTRVQLNNIAYVKERQSQWLCQPKWADGELREDFSKDYKKTHETATVAAVVYAATYGGEQGGSVTLTFYGDEADEFLARYDANRK